MTIGKRLLERRKQLGFTQKQMADNFGLILRTYITYEHDERIPRLSKQWNILAKILNVEVEELKLGRENFDNVTIFKGNIRKELLHIRHLVDALLDKLDNEMKEGQLLPTSAGGLQEHASVTDNP